MMRDVKESLPIFYTRMTPSHFFEVANINSELPLEALSDAIILCVSAIGSANAFVNAMEKVLTFLSIFFFIKIAPCRCWRASCMPSLCPEMDYVASFLLSTFYFFSLNGKYLAADRSILCWSTWLQWPSRISSHGTIIFISAVIYILSSVQFYFCRFARHFVASTTP